MGHAMYSNHEWNILVFQFNYDPKSNTLKHIDLVNSKGN
jgi:hypothetical protein